MEKIKTPENAIKVIMDALNFLEQTRVKIERPIPVVKDRQGKLTEDYTLKELFAKIDEELNEFKQECLKVYTLNDKPGQVAYRPSPINKQRISDECCDVVKSLFTAVMQMDMDGEFMDAAMHNCNVKTRERGCHD